KTASVTGPQRRGRGRCRWPIRKGTTLCIIVFVDRVKLARNVRSDSWVIPKVKSPPLLGRTSRLDFPRWGRSLIMERIVVLQGQTAGWPRTVSTSDSLHGFSRSRRHAVRATIRKPNRRLCGPSCDEGLSHGGS